eukprot:2208674-Prymnesium_polylepis.1
MPFSCTVVTPQRRTSCLAALPPHDGRGRCSRRIRAVAAPRQVGRLVLWNIRASPGQRPCCARPGR